MPPGGDRGLYVPHECRDATKRRVPLFNPVVRGSAPPEDCDFSKAEWRELNAIVALGRRSSGSSWIGTTLIVLLFACAGGAAVYLARSSPRPWLWFPLVTFPLWGTLLLGLLIKSASSRLLGRRAFVDVRDEAVVGALLKQRRCPSCAYRLPAVAQDGLATCSECASRWLPPDAPAVRRAGVVTDA